MTNPILSIITVCFNAASTIHTCIQSVAKDKSPEIEYLIIDGASTDGTVDIVRKYPNIVDTLISERDGGIYDAMNKGVSKAAGEYVMFLNADDMYLPGAIQSVLDVLRKYPDSIDVLYGDWIGVDIKGVNHERRANHLLTWRYALCHQAVVARRAIFPEPHAFDLRYRICADFDLILRWQAEGFRFKRHPVQLVRFSEAGASAQFIRRSAWESIVVAIRRARTPWVPVFITRVALHFVRVRLFYGTITSA